MSGSFISSSGAIYFGPVISTAGSIRMIYDVAGGGTLRIQKYNTGTGTYQDKISWS